MDKRDRKTFELTYAIKNGFSEQYVPLITQMLKQTSWAENITEQQVAIGFSNSICAFVFHKETNELAGFGRLVTDRATFAYVTDVFVRPAYRGKGMAFFISEYLVDHPDIVLVDHLALLSSHKSIGKMYAEFGFAVTDHQNAWMELIR